MSTHLLSKPLSFVLITAVAGSLAGCGLGANVVTPLTQSVPSQTGSASGTSVKVTPGQISGLARGGQQPIVNGTVTLWAAGTSSGYGAGATQVGTSTTTDSNGNFNLNVGGTGTTSQCVNGQLNYITVTKGNPGGGVNNASALMLALPTPCNTVTGYPGGSVVQIDEATTVAAVWALQQFMSITPSNGPYSGSGTPPWNIGAPATNLTGLANAFNNASQLASVTTGTSASYTLTNTVTYPVASANGTQYNSTAGTVIYTSTISPDNNRVNLVSDVLSSCINSTATISITGWAIDSTGTIATLYTPTNLGATPGTTVSLAGFSAGTFLNGQTVTVTAAATGGITALNLTGVGSGYTANPTVTISAPPSGTTATATAVETGGVVTSLTIVNQGSGYTTLPAVTISAPTSGTTATATAQSGGFTATVSGGSPNASNSSDPGTAAVTTGSGISSTCGNLFADVVPTTAVLPTDTIQAAYDIATAPAGLTEYPEAKTGGGTVAAGTAVAPVSLYNANTCTSGVQYCTWALALCDSFVSGTPPFVPVTACAAGTSAPTPTYPTDFAIGVRWSAVDNASTPLTYGVKNGSVAVDSNGDVWTGYTGTSGGTGYPIIEWSPSGQVLQVLGTNGIVSNANQSAFYPMPSTIINVVLNTTSNVEASSSTQFSYSGTPPTVQVLPGSYLSSAVYAIAVDTTNNAWVTDSLAGTVGTGITGFFPGVVFKIAPATGWSYTSGTPSTTSTAGQVTPYLTGANSGAIAIDGSNNLWMETGATTGGGTSGNLTLIPAAGGYNTLYEGQYVSKIINQVAIDGNGIATGFLNETTTMGEPIYRNSVTTAETPGSFTSLNLSSGYSTLIPIIGAIDASNNIWMGEWKSGTGQIAYLTPGTLPAATPSNIHASAISTSYINNNYFAGLQSPASISIDGLGNVFILNGVTTTSGGISELTSSGVQLTPTNAGAGMPAYGLNTYATDAGRSGAIDESGNLWTGANSNSYEVHMVGLAAPVTTPLATQVGTSKIAQRP